MLSGVSATEEVRASLLSSAYGTYIFSSLETTFARLIYLARYPVSALAVKPPAIDITSDMWLCDGTLYMPGFLTAPATSTYVVAWPLESVRDEPMVTAGLFPRSRRVARIIISAITIVTTEADMKTNSALKNRRVVYHGFSDSI